jgi:hypothetical protein
MLFIQLWLLIFDPSSLSIQLLKKEVMPATKLRCDRPTGTSHTWSPNFSRSVMKIKIMPPENYSQHYVIYIRNKMCSFSSISKDYMSLQASCQIFVDRPASLGSSISRSLASDVQIHFVSLIFHTVLIFIAFAFLTVSWIMTSPSVWLKSTHLIDDELLWRAKIFIQSWSSFHFMFQNLLEFPKSWRLSFDPYNRLSVIIARGERCLGVHAMCNEDKIPMEWWITVQNIYRVPRCRRSLLWPVLWAFANTDWLQRTVSFHDLIQHETLEFNAEARFEQGKERYVRLCSFDIPSFPVHSGGDRLQKQILLIVSCCPSERQRLQRFVWHPCSRPNIDTAILSPSKCFLRFCTNLSPSAVLQTILWRLWYCM